MHSVVYYLVTRMEIGSYGNLHFARVVILSALRGVSLVLKLA